VHPVTLGIGLGGKKARQPQRVSYRRNAQRVQPGTGCGNGAAVNVGGKHLYGVLCLSASIRSCSKMASEYASSPVEQPATQTRTTPPGGFAGKQQRDHLLFQHRKCLGVAEKVGHTNQQVAKQRLDFFGLALQVRT
jgi:hypothetical protein